MDLVGIALNTVIGVIIVGGTIGFLMQQEPPSAAVFNEVPEEVVASPSPTLTNGPCPSAGPCAAAPSYAPPTKPA